MQDIQYLITVPYNTLAISPYEQTVNLLRGTLTNVLIEFPPGCARMVHVQIYIGDRIVLPSDVDMSYAFDGVTLNRDCVVPLDIEPYAIKIRLWSPDTVYNHTINFIFQIDDEHDLKTRILNAVFG